jgi:hypothetical protein
MAEDSTTTTAPAPPPRARRSSFAGQTFADLFGGGRSRPSGEASPPANPQQQYSGPISQAAAQAQKRRLSLTTLGLSGSPNQTSPFGSYRGIRRDSIGSANSGSIDESAIEDDAPRDPTSASTPATPFARRMSFGARALRDVRNSAGGGGGGGGGGNGGGGGGGGTTSAGQNGTKSPPASNANKAQTNGPISSRDIKKGRGLSSLHQSSSSPPAASSHRHSLSMPFTFSKLTVKCDYRLSRLLDREHAHPCRADIHQQRRSAHHAAHACQSQERGHDGVAHQGDAACQGGAEARPLPGEDAPRRAVLGLTGLPVTNAG